LGALHTDELRRAKRLGLSDELIGEHTKASAAAVRAQRETPGVTPVFKTVDTCAREVAARTPHHYSTYPKETEVGEAARPRAGIAADSRRCCTSSRSLRRPTARPGRCPRLARSRLGSGTRSWSARATSWGEERWRSSTTTRSSSVSSAWPPRPHPSTRC